MTFHDDINRAVEVMNNGGIILYPTDTIWGIGCDATNADAVAKIYALKQRDDSKALITLVPSSAWIERYVDEVPDVAWELIDVAVAPLTIIYDKGRNLAANLMAPDGSVGIRVTGEAYSAELCRRLRKPVVSTSANISGMTSPALFSHITPEILSGVDYVATWRRDDTSVSKPSGVIKLSKGGLIKILR